MTYWNSSVLSTSDHIHVILLSSKIRTQFMYHFCQHYVIEHPDSETSLVTLNFILSFTTTMFRLSFSLVFWFLCLFLSCQTFGPQTYCPVSTVSSKIPDLSWEHSRQIICNIILRTIFIHFHHPKYTQF